MSSNDLLDTDETVILKDITIKTGLDFCWQFQLEDPTQDPIPNPDYDSSKPVSDSNRVEIFPPLDLNNYTGVLEIRSGDTRDSTLIHRADSTVNFQLTFNDPDIGWVKVFIDRTITGEELDEEDVLYPSLGNFAGRCAFYSLVLDPAAPGEKNFELFKGKVNIKEITASV